MSKLKQGIKIIKNGAEIGTDALFDAAGSLANIPEKRIKEGLKYTQKLFKEAKENEQRAAVDQLYFSAIEPKPDTLQAQTLRDFIFSLYVNFLGDFESTPPAAREQFNALLESFGDEINIKELLELRLKSLNFITVPEPPIVIFQLRTYP